MTATRREASVGPIGVVDDVTIRGEQRDRVVHLGGVVLVLEQVGYLVRRSRSVEQRRESLVQPAREHDRRSFAEQRDAVAVDHVYREMPAERRTFGKASVESPRSMPSLSAPEAERRTADRRAVAQTPDPRERS